jgi:Co/Zn/Cd efflux system component
MDCSADEQLVRMRLSHLPAVRDVSVDLGARTVSVNVDGSPEEVLAPLRELGLGASLITEHATTRLRDADPPEVRSERSALTVALVINASFFVVELGAGLVSGSMGLVADSLDMLADASVYGLSLVAVGQASYRQDRLAASSGYLQLALAVIGLAEVVRRFATDESPPDATFMVVVASISLVANVVVLVVLGRARGPATHLQAAWIFTSNDVKVNALVIVAAGLVGATGSAVPDLVVGALVFLIVANGARRILRLTRSPRPHG